MRSIAALLAALPLLASAQAPQPQPRPAAPASADWEQVPPPEPAPAAQPASTPAPAAQPAAPASLPPPEPPPAYPPPPQAAPPAPQAAPPAQYVPPTARPPHTRDSWYIGFGIGGGDGLVASDTETLSFKEANRNQSTTAVFVNFKVGGTLTPKLLLGGDISGISAASDSGGVTSSVTISNVDAVLTYFPVERGFFLRGGIGLSGISQSLDDGVQKVDDSASGFNVEGGLGYAFWIGKQFNLTANLDASRQWFGSSGTFRWKDSQFWSLWLGFDWY